MVIDSDPPIPEMPGLAGRRIALAKPENIASPPLRQILVRWLAYAGSGAVRRRDFDITQHAAIASHLFLIDLIEGGYQLSLAGENYLRLVDVKKGKPYRSVGRLELTERYWIDFEALICPARGADESPAGFIGAAAEIDT